MHGANELDSRSVAGDNDHRLLLVLGRRGVALAHDEVDVVAGVSGARDPPLVAVDDNLVALDADRGLDVGGTANVGR